MAELLDRDTPAMLPTRSIRRRSGKSGFTGFNEYLVVRYGNDDSMRGVTAGSNADMASLRRGSRHHRLDQTIQREGERWPYQWKAPICTTGQHEGASGLSGAATCAGSQCDREGLIGCLRFSSRVRFPATHAECAASSRPEGPEAAMSSPKMPSCNYRRMLAQPVFVRLN